MATQLATLLESLEVTLDATFVRFHADDWQHFEWLVTVTRGQQSHTTAYRMGTASVKPMPASFMPDDANRVRDRAWLRHPKSPVPPTVDAVVASLMSDAQSGLELFEDFCGNNGYETDSRKALDLYLACQSAATAMRKLFREHHDVVAAAAAEY